ncbi:OprO/OprP family phosphate-selective porin [Sphingobium boeckii]|uniref:Phosphate-selective porin OprO/OprP n=1 Tax=Sphingobium boeckii TaxID=1082345 RepID=A0A7W9AH94_9SPHN|nr:porin [Sphingobium boeckii]MBB5685543.1 phosphate-selective porin OprO/OprP [Sphingobium boeckii]
MTDWGKRLALLMAASALCAPGLALAQSADDVAALRAEIQRLKDQVSTLETRLDAMAPALANPAPPAAAPAPMAAAAPPKPADQTKIAWKGAPEMSQSSEWLFKIRGRIQADIGYVDAPRASTDRGLGSVSEMRRARIGAEGTMPGGFGYKIEADYSDNQVEMVDAYLTYAHGPMTVMVGQQNPGWSLDELTSDSGTSFMERAAFTDAFEFERRVGASITYMGKAFTVSGGGFTDNVGDLSNAVDGPSGGDENNSYSVDARSVWFPVAGKTQLHFGGSVHWRDRGDLSRALTRYRQRPFLHGTNTRFLTTDAFNVQSELGYGAEFAAVRGSLHVAAEAAWLRADMVSGERPTFFGSYGEIGYYLTGETRGYKNGIFARTKVRRPLGKGGMGAFQVNLRYDYLDLSDDGVIGGKQDAYLASLIWTPVDLMRVSLNYGWLDYHDALRSSGVRDDFGVSTVGMRAEIDF